jgi:hypothetical protein
VDLNKSGVSSNVIKVMLAPKTEASTPVATPAPVAADPNDPLAPHESGIYMYVTKSNRKEMILLEPTVYTQGKSGGVFASAMTYGIAKMKWKAVIRAPHASIRTTDANVVFYFYFEEKSAGLSHANFGTSTPNEFTLLKFDVKGETRETIVMQANAFGAQTGTQDKASVGFAFEKIRPGVYKVTPNGVLNPGEYGFLSAAAMGAFAPGAASASRVFDFGVIPAE